MNEGACSIVEYVREWEALGPFSLSIFSTICWMTISHAFSDIHHFLPEISEKFPCDMYLTVWFMISTNLKKKLKRE